MAQAGLPVGARVPYALVLIDFINPLDFPGAEDLGAGAEMASRAAVQLRSRVDAAGGVTIYANDNYGQWQSNFSDLLKRCAGRGGVAARISRTLAPRPNDIMVLKPRHSAFFCTPLDLILRSLNCKKLILAGLAADNCILFSAMDAYVHEYRLWVPSDCTAAESDEALTSSLRHMARVLKAETRPAV